MPILSEFTQKEGSIFLITGTFELKSSLSWLLGWKMLADPWRISKVWLMPYWSCLLWLVLGSKQPSVQDLGQILSWVLLSSTNLVNLGPSGHRKFLTCCGLRIVQTIEPAALCLVVVGKDKKHWWSQGPNGSHARVWSSKRINVWPEAWLPSCITVHFSVWRWGGGGGKIW